MHDRFLRNGSRVAFVVAAACLAPVSSAEIFRCVASNGLPLYQNFPCQFDSLSAMGVLLRVQGPGASASQFENPGPRIADAHSQAAIVPAEALVAVRGEAKMTPFVDNVAVRMAGVSEPRAGMSADEIRTLFGEPVEIMSEGPSELGSAESWRYESRMIHFDLGGRVVSFESF